jgi:superfamily II DNA or RNA helicase/HKD family nuclease/diadenosine tetraphosphate (Ap4A) HIT family hydrolase
MPNACPLCSIDAASVVHEGPLSFVIWDRYPVSEGHALVVAKRHVVGWFDATPDEQRDMLASADVARRLIEAEFGAEGYNLGVNVGAVAGQTVPHLHLHVIPRRAGDVENPVGGVRGVIPGRADYSGELEDDGPSAVSDLQARYSARGTDVSRVVGGPEQPLLPHLLRHLDHAKRADLVVAFVLESGVAALESALRGFLSRGGQLRLLTGDYFDVTEPRALLRLLDLVDYAEDDESEASVELRVFESGSGSFHPKAYIFGEGSNRELDEYGVAYIGSSNLSATALGKGVEWNYSLGKQRDRHGFDQVRDAFDRLFRHAQSRPLTTEWVAAYSRRRKPRSSASIEAFEVPQEAPPPPAEPHEILRDALDALCTTRAAGNEAGLVVMATGLGKTWLAAFDVRAEQPERILFVAHREEILRQAQSTFRCILPEASFGRFDGVEKAPDADVLFGSIQTLGRAAHLKGFAPDAFDYIVIDEFHHAAAAGYRRLIEHFNPRFLLGLTATPERTDGGNLLSLCGENLVYRCDLFEAIRRAGDRLVPFHYYGVPDEVDYANIPWKGRRFDTEALTQHVATTARADNALDQWRLRSGERTLGFCCSVDHADFMARHFVAAGVNAVSLHSGDTSAPRTQTLDDLESGEIEVVFAVDILNEGVDIPSVDTILMLRPTESRIVFLQQLGRGLRAHEGKTHLTVIDYIGNHKSFRLKPETLLQLPGGDAALVAALQAMQDGNGEDLELPPGCEVTYELEAIDLLRGQLRSPRAGQRLLDWYDEFKERTGERPVAVEAFHEGYNPRTAKHTHGSWMRFVAAQGDLAPRARTLVESDEPASAFLTELEQTRMERSFKMLVILAMLRMDALPGAIAIDDLVRQFAELAGRSERLRAEVGVDLADAAQVRQYVMQNPIRAWCGTRRAGSNASAFFEREGDQLRTTFNVASYLRDEFQTIVRELAEWRIADHLGGRATTTDHELRLLCPVIQTNGKPILKLPDRTRVDGVPEGTLEVRINDVVHEVRFVKQYINVIHIAGADTNVLPEIVRGWFGEQAGQPGTKFAVAFELDEDGWSAKAAEPGESGARVERASELTPPLRVIGTDGAELDASYQVEAVGGRIELIYHSRGGTGGTQQAVNTQYAAGLEVLLQRLAQADGRLDDILLDSSQAVRKPIAERRLSLRGDRSYPIELAAEPDFDDLRRAISAAQGKNPNRRLRITLGGFDGWTLQQLVNLTRGLSAGSSS